MKRIFSFQFFLLFNLIFSQIGDLGPLIDKYPDLQIHDSLSFFIHEGKSSQIDYLLEGGALEIESESVISVTFSIKIVSYEIYSIVDFFMQFQILNKTRFLSKLFVQ